MISQGTQVTAIIGDGNVAIPIAAAVSILEDGSSLQQISVQLINPIESEQDLQLDVSALPNSIVQPKVSKKFNISSACCIRLVDSLFRMLHGVGT